MWLEEERETPPGPSEMKHQLGPVGVGHRAPSNYVGE